jgi:predicted acyl esterase
LVSSYTSWKLDGGGALKVGKAGSTGNVSLGWGDPAYAGNRLTFTSPALAKGTTLAGPMNATIYASSNNTNVELIARLYDVAPDGIAKQITLGAALGSQRQLDPINSWHDSRGKMIRPWPYLKSDSFLKPDKIYRFDIAMAPRLWAIEPNHQLRLELTTQSPTNICPPGGGRTGLGVDPCGLTAPQERTLPTGKYKIFYGRGWQSELNLPQLPWKALPEAASAVLPTAWNEGMRTIEPSKITLPIDWGTTEK